MEKAVKMTGVLINKLFLSTSKLANMVFIIKSICCHIKITGLIEISQEAVCYESVIAGARKCFPY